MKFSFIFVLIVTSLPLVTPIAALTVFQLTAKASQIGKTVLEIFLSIKGHADLIDTAMSNKENAKLFSKLDNINLQMNDLNEQLHGIGNDVNMIVQMLNSLPEVIRLELKLHDIRSKQFFLDTYYSEMERYVRDLEEYENSTLIAFADDVVAARSNSVPFLMKLIYQQVISNDFLQLFYKNFAAQQTSYFCTGQQSLPEVYHHFLNEMILLNTKTYVLTHAAYMIKKSFGKGNFIQEIVDANKDFRNQINGLVTSIKPYMSRASAELWRCEPHKHKEGETFLEIKNFLHGYIINKANLDQNGRCREECDVYTYANVRRCNGNDWCEKQPLCPKAVKCQYIDSSMNVCSLKQMPKENRKRYEYIQTGNGQVYGKKKGCHNGQVNYLETYRYWIVYKCSYCFCICDEDPRFAERFINLRPSLSNVNKNRVVTGVRFVKQNGIIHLQIQEGQLLEFGQIDLDSVRWVPPDNYTKIDKNIRDGEDYHTITWEQRAFDLADIKAKDGSVITGVKFIKVGSRLHLEVQSTPFNFTTGQLFPKKSVSQLDPNLQWKHKFSRELKLNNPDVPTLCESRSTDITTDKYVQFVNSDIVKDAAQTTVPFFDAQPVASAKPVPLAGIGIFHRGRSGYGGFITPRIFTYNFSKHLGPVFPPDQKQRLGKN